MAAQDPSFWSLRPTLRTSELDEIKTQSESSNASLSTTGQVHSQGMTTWDSEPQAPHLKAWLEQTSALGEEGELPSGGRWPRVVDSLMSLVTGQGQAAETS